MRNTKQDKVVAEQVARTADADFTFVSGHTGGIFVIDVTATAATPSVVFTIRGQEPLSNNVWDILASSAITSTGTTILRVHPSLAASANAIAKDILPQSVVINANHADTDSITYSIRYIGVD